MPFASIGFHRPELLPAARAAARLLDNTQQIQRFYQRYRQAKPAAPALSPSALPSTSSHHPSTSSHLPSTSSHLPSPPSHLPSTSSHLLSPPSHLPSISSHLPSTSSHLPSTSSALLSPPSNPLSSQLDAYEAGRAFSAAVQRVVDNTHIRYAWCLLGLGLQLAALLPPLRAKTVALWRSRGPARSLLAAGWLAAFGCGFTSYRLITRPGSFFLLLAGCAALLTPALSLATRTKLLLPALLASSPHLTSLALPAVVVLLVLPLCFSHLSSPHPLSHLSSPHPFSHLSSLAAVLLSLSAALHFLQPHEEPATLPALLCFGLTVALRHASPPLALAALALFAVVLNGVATAPVTLALLLSCLALRRLPKDSPLSPLLALALAQHFAYQTAPSFSFSSIRWAPAFVLTHRTLFLLQGVAVVCSILYPFVAVATVWEKDELLLGQMVAVVLATMSVLYNTSSPVVWSVFTPFLLFMCAIWVVLVVCLGVCLYGHSLLWIYRVFLVSTLIHEPISRNRIRSCGRGATW